jgi:L-2,4-diaminobutyrate decarboxylase
MDESKSLENIFDEEDFRSKGHELVNILADYLKEAKASKINTINYKEPETLLSEWTSKLNEKSSFSELVQQVMDYSIHLHNPKYIGHQVAVTAPMSSLVDMLVSILNNGVGVYEMGSAGTIVEKILIDKFSEKFGFTDGGGFFTSGGTLANLTVLLAARQLKAPTNVWEEGSKQQLALLVSDQAHYCVDRAVRVMGWGDDGIIKIPVDEEYRMRTDLIPQYLEEAKSKGIHVIAIVGSAPSTSTGKYDDLNEIARYAKEYDIWFHVDGAHGGPVIYSPQYANLINGVAQADSIIFDTHKMMLTSALATVVLFRNAKTSYSAFQVKADYLWEKSHEAEWHNLAKRTFECTKQMFALRIFFMFQLYGESVIEEHFTKTFTLARTFADTIKSDDAFDLAVYPDSNIVCFRWKGQLENVEDINKCNQYIRRQLLEDGTFYIVQTKLKEDTWLRISIMNPITSLLDLHELLQLIKINAANYQGLEKNELSD